MFISTHDADRGSSPSLVSAGLLAAVLAAGSVSCAELDPANDSCARIPGCLEQELVPLQPDAGTDPLYVQDPTRWGCLAPGYTPPAIPATTAQGFTLSSIVLDYATGIPLQGLSVKFCLNMDANCEGGRVAVSAPSPVPGVDVNVQPIPTGSLGFLRQEAPGHVTQDYFLLAPMLKDDATYVGPAPTDFFFLVSESTITGFISDVGIAVDPGLGLLTMAVVDCNGARVEGAKVTLTELDTRPELRAARGWSINNRFPVLDAVTDKDGLSGLVNVAQPGTVEVQATVNGQNFGKTRIRVLGNRITAAMIRPLYLTGK